MASNSNSFEDYDEQPQQLRPRRQDPFTRLGNGGISSSSLGQVQELTEQQQYQFERSLGPGSKRSLSGIALRAFLLGVVFAVASLLNLYFIFERPHPLWRLPFMMATLSLFHFLEFWTTARYNTRSADVSSFLLSSNGRAYRIAHAAALTECALVVGVWPERQWLPAWVTQAVVVLGLVLVIGGQGIRSTAMVHASTNFNHIVQWKKDTTHRLVTDGIYTYLRHPSYFGYFWWALGTQLVLGNVVCFVAYSIVLWQFFSARIQEEERLLVQFFGDKYVQYRKRSIIGIPFMR